MCEPESLLHCYQRRRVSIKPHRVYMNELQLAFATSTSPYATTSTCVQVRELLTFYQFKGDEIPIIRGSALAAVNNTTPEIGKWQHDNANTESELRMSVTQ